jgi:hypothetical protein
LALCIVAGIVWSVGHLYVNHYLPQPFFYEPSDIYADWFNTAFWARNKGAYDVWQTVYPPLSFVFLRHLGLDRCYPDRRSFDASAGLAARDCDGVGIAMIWLIFLVNLVLVWLTFQKLDRKTALQRTICVGLGMPMLSGVERGNLVLIAFTCLVLALGPILRSARLRWLFAGLAVNFKVYLIASIVPLLLKRRWRWVECALISVILVYMFSYAILGRGTPLEIFSNIREFSNLPSGSILDVWSETTYQALMSLLQGDNFPAILLIGSGNQNLLLILLPAVLHLTQALILAAAVATWVRPECIPAYRLINLGVLLALITSEAGGYTPIFFMLFVMMERWEGVGRRWAIIACYVLALPFDIPIYGLPPLARNTYLGGETTMVTFYVAVGPFVRPLIIMTIAVALSLTTIHEVWKDIRLQGWAGRWRLRRDAPLLPGVRRPTPPPIAR